MREKTLFRIVSGYVKYIMWLNGESEFEFFCGFVKSMSIKFSMLESRFFHGRIKMLIYNEKIFIHIQKLHKYKMFVKIWFEIQFRLRGNKNIYRLFCV